MRKKSLTKTQAEENITKVFESIAVFLVCALLLAVIIFSLPL